MIARKFLLMVFALLTIVFVGCKDEDPEFYALNVENKTIQEGQTYQFYVEKYQGHIKWSIDSEEFASIDQTGKVKGVKIGETKVRAKLSNGASLMASLTVVGRDAYVGADGELENLSDSITIKYETADLDEIKLAPLKSIKFGVNIDSPSKKYINTELYPLHVIIKEANNTMSVASGQEIPDFPYSEVVLREDSTGYDVEVFAGSQRGDYVCEISLGTFSKVIPFDVSYGVYLSHNTIVVDDLNNDIGLLTFKSIKAGAYLDGNYNFNCYIDGATEEQKNEIEAILLDKENYIIEGLNVELGDITINKGETENSPWLVSMPILSKSEVYENGTISLSIEDKTLILNLTVDNGTYFKEVYLSFSQVNTYEEETKLNARKTEETFLKYVGGTDPNAGIGEKFKVLIYYTITPDDRGDYINWKISTSQDGIIAPVSVIGYKRVETAPGQYSNSQFEFEFQVNAAGTSEIKISTENPKADDPELTEEQKEKYNYENYRDQTLTAYVIVQDRQTVNVNEVYFVSEKGGSDEIKTKGTTSKTEPLYTYIDPVESSGSWNSVFSVECSEGAEATVEQSKQLEDGSFSDAQLHISRPGKIVVTAVAKDKTATLEVIAKLKLSNKTVEMTGINQNLIPGEEDIISPKASTDYTLYTTDFTWESSDESVVTVKDGKVTAIADGTAVVTCSITDEFGTTATGTLPYTVKSLNADINLDDEIYADHYVIQTQEDLDNGQVSTYYIDTEDGDPNGNYYTMTLEKPISGDGVYSVTGTVSSGLDEFKIGEGSTIKISGDEWTLDLYLQGKVNGKMTGTKPYLLFE